ncbi:MAG TPA: hypothetical protein VJZ71_04395 [Phycisphaerae bacterium]|nr:hypothetical protein [Phycisphaerae bacterium]
MDEIPIGLAYRAACSASVTIFVEVINPDDAGSLSAYVSYGCDRVHWSDWQPPDASKRYTGDPPPPLFCSDITVKRKDAEYFKAQLEKLGEPEEGKARGTDGLFRWIAKRQPDLFERVIPAVGYIRIKIVNPSDKLITLSRVNALISSYVSGMHRLGEPFDTDTRWNFDLRAATSQPTSQPATMPAAGNERSSGTANESEEN